MTERLYYHDSRLTRFSSAVTESDAAGTRIRLASSAFYPTSGGQPFDTGTLAGKPVIEVTDEVDEIVHVLGEPLSALPGSQVECEIDWSRRRDHMQQHTGQHLLSAILVDLFGWETLSFHMGPAVSTIEISSAAPDRGSLERAERRANELIAENRRVTITFEDAAAAAGLRKASSRSGMNRIVSIEDLDRSACGGTHVSHTGEIGSLLLRGTEKIRGNTRIEFVCGLRAVSRARHDYELLSAIAATLHAAPEDTPTLVSAQAERLADSEKIRRRLSLEAAKLEGRRLWEKAEISPGGLRIHRRQAAEFDEDLRAEAQGFTEAGRAVYLGRSAIGILLAVSPDTGLHAGNLLKPILQRYGGRGGGSAQLAQGSVPPESVQLAADDLLAQVRN